VILFTKADKISKARHTANPSLYRKSLLATLNIDPVFILTSAEKKTGREEILDCIEEELNSRDA
jgi:GTP-binding protein